MSVGIVLVARRGEGIPIILGAIGGFRCVILGRAERLAQMRTLFVQAVGGGSLGVSVGLRT